MPANLAFHKRNALALNGVGNDNGGMALHGTSFGKGRTQLVKVAAIGNLDNVEFERPELLANRNR